MDNAHGTWCAAEMCVTYHSIPTVGSSAGTSADNFIYAFLVDGCIASDLIKGNIYLLLVSETIIDSSFSPPHNF